MPLDVIFVYRLPTDMVLPPVGFRIEMHHSEDTGFYAVLSLPWRQPGGDLIMLPGELVEVGLGSEMTDKGKRTTLELRRGKTE